MPGSLGPSPRGAVGAYFLAVPIDLATLARMDAQGYEELVALTDDNRQAATLSKAHTFICDDGRTYWLKGKAQHGLVAELVAGRLAALVGAGPVARIVRVTSEALPADGSCEHLLGVIVGSEDEKAAVNSRELDQLAPPEFNPELLDPESRALVVAFQTWIGVKDVQVLVNFKSGRIGSIDHGDCFSDTTAGDEPKLNRLTIKGVPDSLGSDQVSLGGAAKKIEEVTDQEILEAVARVPDGTAWQSAVDRRVEIAKWLVGRRGELREVLKTWA